MRNHENCYWMFDGMQHHEFIVACFELDDSQRLIDKLYDGSGSPLNTKAHHWAQMQAMEEKQNMRWAERVNPLLKNAYDIQECIDIDEQMLRYAR